MTIFLIEFGTILRNFGDFFRKKIRNFRNFAKFRKSMDEVLAGDGRHAKIRLTWGNDPSMDDVSGVSPIFFAAKFSKLFSKKTKKMMKRAMDGTFPGVSNTSRGQKIERAKKTKILPPKYGRAPGFEAGEPPLGHQFARENRRFRPLKLATRGRISEDLLRISQLRVPRGGVRCAIHKNCLGCPAFESG